MKEKNEKVTYILTNADYIPSWDDTSICGIVSACALLTFSVVQGFTRSFPFYIANRPLCALLRKATIFKEQIQFERF